ncbi:MAG: right-handed parallel beta-helix repeat-containing protein [Methanomicrobiales archaeon]|nr:right-handed parallel beta-helix repeat-containing protein [Methanomicrobiales archaeon]
MSELPRKKLTDIIQKNGKSLCRDPIRCEGLLRDLCPGHPREISVIIAALHQQVGTDLISPPHGISLEHHLHQLSRRMYENLGICDRFAWWAVISWALALRVIDRESEVKPPRELEDIKISLRVKGKASSHTQPGSLIVAPDGSGHVSSIGDALKKASPHTQIYLRPGRYQGNLTVTTPLQIIGEGRPSEIVIEGINGPCLTLANSGCLVHGVTLDQKGVPSELPSSALDIIRGACVVEDCRILTPGIGVAIRGGRADPILRRCSILSTGEYGVVMERGKGLVESCRIEGAVRGISIRGKTSALFRGLAILHGYIGIEIRDHGSAIVDACEITDQSYAGITIQESSNPEIRGCTISRAQFGVEVTDRGRGILDQCTIQGCAQGVLISERGDPTICACTLRHNQFGIRVTSDGRGKIQNSDISENEFAGISIKEKGNPVISGCRVTKNGDIGIWVQKSGLGTLEGNDLRGNRKGNLSIDEGSQVHQRKNLL